MKKTLLLTAALAVLSVGLANAQNVAQPPGLNLSWTDCDAPLGSTGLNIAATCASNTTPAARSLIGSYIAPAVVAIDANDWLLDIQTATTPLPCWWNFTAANTLRSVQWAMNAITAPASGNCMDYFGFVTGGVQFAAAQPSLYAGKLNRLRFQGTEGVNADAAPTAAQPAEGDEVYSFTLQIRPGATIGTACPGCLDPACMVLNQLIISQTPPAPTLLVVGSSTRNYVTWRGGAIDAPGCPLATPTVSKTWGSLKTLYR